MKIPRRRWMAAAAVSTLNLACTAHRHSRNFTFEEYQWLGMPYCHMLPFADFHQWEAETRHPDLLSKDFEEWCDYVARAHCARFYKGKPHAWFNKDPDW